MKARIEKTERDQQVSHANWVQSARRRKTQNFGFIDNRQQTKQLARLQKTANSRSHPARPAIIQRRGKKIPNAKEFLQKLNAVKKEWADIRRRYVSIDVLTPLIKRTDVVLLVMHNHTRLFFQEKDPDVLELIKSNLTFDYIAYKYLRNHILYFGNTLHIASDWSDFPERFRDDGYDYPGREKAKANVKSVLSRVKTIHKQIKVVDYQVRVADFRYIRPNKPDFVTWLIPIGSNLPGYKRETKRAKEELLTVQKCQEEVNRFLAGTRKYSTQGAAEGTLEIFGIGPIKKLYDAVKVYDAYQDFKRLSRVIVKIEELKALEIFTDRLKRYSEGGLMGLGRDLGHNNFDILPALGALDLDALSASAKSGFGGEGAARIKSQCRSIVIKALKIAVMMRKKLLQAVYPFVEAVAGIAQGATSLERIIKEATSRISDTINSFSATALDYGPMVHSLLRQALHKLLSKNKFVGVFKKLPSGQAESLIDELVKPIKRRIIRTLNRKVGPIQELIQPIKENVMKKMETTLNRAPDLARSGLAGVALLKNIPIGSSLADFWEEIEGVFPNALYTIMLQREIGGKVFRMEHPVLPPGRFEPSLPETVLNYTIRFKSGGQVKSWNGQMIKSSANEHAEEIFLKKHLPELDCRLKKEKQIDPGVKFDVMMHLNRSPCSDSAKIFKKYPELKKLRFAEKLKADGCVDLLIKMAKSRPDIRFSLSMGSIYGIREKLTDEDKESKKKVGTPPPDEMQNSSTRRLKKLPGEGKNEKQHLLAFAEKYKVSSVSNFYPLTVREDFERMAQGKIRLLTYTSIKAKVDKYFRRRKKKE